MTRLLLALSVSVLLGGNAATVGAGLLDAMAQLQPLSQQTVAFVPGYPVISEGKRIRMHGHGVCPLYGTDNTLVIGATGSYVGEGKAGCVVLEPMDRRILVHLLVEGRPLNRVWKVDRADDKLRLYTNTGAIVLPDNQ